MDKVGAHIFNTLFMTVLSVDGQQHLILHVPQREADTDHVCIADKHKPKQFLHLDTTGHGGLIMQVGTGILVEDVVLPRIMVITGIAIVMDIVILVAIKCLF